ncbi:MAG: stage II sporulation protein P [Eubacteriales bacterium]
MRHHKNRATRLQMNDSAVIATPKAKRLNNVIFLFLWKFILYLTAVSAIAGAFTVRVISALEYKKSTGETTILIEDYDEPTAIAYYDLLYINDKETNTEIKTDVELYNIDRSSIPEGKSALLPINLSRNGMQLINETEYTPDLDSLLLSEIELPFYTDINYNYTSFVEIKEQPLVLILHTHGTESYAAEGEISYESDYGFRSNDINQNVVAVGKAMSETLNLCGVPTVHCIVMHDKESYLNSYKRAAETISFYLNKYPSIVCVLDIHRDALQNSNGDILRPVTEIEFNGISETAAQIMAVIGSDYRGAIHPKWRDNLVLALKLKNNLDLRYTNLSRPINLRGAAFNQQYAPLSLLLEIGSTGNTLAEAIRSGIIVADTLAGILLQITS